MRVFCFFVLSMVMNTCLQAQTLRGRVVAEDTRKPIASANVYLANTSVGTATNENGEFTIVNFPAGRYDLVVSFVGFEPYSMSIQSNKLPSHLDIAIKPKANELQEVILEPYLKDGWQQWGKFFLENFIGTAPGSADCKLINPEVLRFYFNKKANTLRVSADDRLVVENNYLGYHLKYDLTGFEVNFSTHMYVFNGYPQFEEMETKRTGLQKRWRNHRENEYYGSMMHFMRALYRNKIEQEGFEMYRLVKIPEEEKKRVKKIYLDRSRITNADGTLTIGNGYAGLPPDTAEYYRKVMQHPEQLNKRGKNALTGDSVAFAIDSTIAGLNFADWLDVRYKKKTMPPEYFAFHNQSPVKAPLMSELTRSSAEDIRIWSNGAYYNGTTLISLGYWAWSEKVAALLPLDYWPEKK